MLASFLCGEFLLHIPCWLYFCLGSLSYTSCAGFISYASHAGFIFMWGVSLTYPVLSSSLFLFYFILSGEFLLHIPCWIHFYLGTFSYTSHAGFIFIWGVSLTRPGLASFFIWGVSLTHHMLASLLCREFLLHVQCCLQFYARRFPYIIPTFFILGTFSYTSHAGFIFVCGVSLIHSVLASFLCG